MSTLRDVWENKGYRSASELARAAHVSTFTVYKLLRLQPLRTRGKAAVLRVLGITEEVYEQLIAEQPIGTSHLHNKRR